MSLSVCFVIVVQFFLGEAEGMKLDLHYFLNAVHFIKKQNKYNRTKSIRR